LLLFLSACAPYHQIYYPAGGGYGVAQRNYYGGYPYRYYNYSSPYGSHHHYDDDDNSHNSRHSWYDPYVRPSSRNNFNRYQPDRKHKQFGYSGSTYPDFKDHHDQSGGDNKWSKPQSDRPWKPDNRHPGSSHSGAQNYRPDDRRNQTKEQRHYEDKKDKRGP
jgi:hypothetical protein